MQTRCMTEVRQPEPRRRRRKTVAAATAAPPKSSVVQVRLQPDEIAALHAAMRDLRLDSTSDALREGIRMLVREAAEVTAATEIQRFYGGRAAPLPDGVVAATDEDLAAADATQW